MDNLFDTSLLITTGKREKATNYIPDLDIYEFYWPEIKLGTQKNPFRIEIKSASFSLYYVDDKVEWKDFGGSGAQGDVFDFVIAWYKKFKQINLEGFQQANERIWEDMSLENKELAKKDDFVLTGQTQSGRKRPKGDYEIAVTDIGWTKWALGYWINRYGICPKILEDYNCGHAKEVWVTPPGKPTYLWGVSTETNPIFYFHFPRTNHIKCYAPMAKNRKSKWIMNCDNLTDIQGYHQLKIKMNKPNLLIQTKAMKEVMFYRSFHIDAIAIHGENHLFHPDFIRHIKKYSSHQLSIYDNDRPGKHAAWRLRKDTGIPAYFIKEAKNITDLWEKDKRAVWKYIDLLKKEYL